MLTFSQSIQKRPQVHYHINNVSRLVTILSQINPAHGLLSYAFKIYLLLISHHRLDLSSHLFTFLNRNPVCIPLHSIRATFPALRDLMRNTDHEALYHAVTLLNTLL